jgi:SAM-dependent methyltransferase
MKGVRLPGQRERIDEVPMSSSIGSEGRGYDDFYGEFDSPLMRQLRSEGYGRDIGQHSWVSAEELEEDIPRLKLTRSSRLLDLGCGPGGPLAFVTGLVGCHGSGMDLSAKAIAAGRARVASLGLDKLVALREADLNEPIPFASGSFDAVMSLDAILHFRDRLSVFREVARVLIPSGRFLFTDAGVITGAISDEEIRLRATHGYTQFVPPGFNERMLELAGFQLIDRNDRTASLLKNAEGRLGARLAHRAELEQLEGGSYFESQRRYLETVLGLAQRGALARMMYLAESR